MLAATVLMLAPLPAAAADFDFDARWGAWGEIGATYGTEESTYGEIAVFAPLWQDPDSLLFTEIRGKYFETDLIEGNAMLGVRQMTAWGFNLGAWGGLDVRKTASDNLFGQVSGGVELLSEHFDARFNGYLPFTDAQSVNGGGEVVLEGSNIFMLGGAEVALYGVDGEIGGRLSLAPNNAATLGVYGGGFWFDHEDAAEAISGGKARVELAFNDVLGAGSQFSASYSYTDDNVRGERHLIGARLRIPIGAPPPAAATASGQWLRMADRIERDVDIVTGASKEQVINDYNDGLVTSAVVADAGDGQAALQAALDGGGDGRVVILDGALAGLTTTTGVKARTTLIGGDTDLPVRGAKSGTAGMFNAGLGAGTISGAVLSGGSVTLAEASVVGGLTVANTEETGFGNGNHGLLAVDAPGAIVFGNTVTVSFGGGPDGALSFGIAFQGSDHAAAIGNTVDGATPATGGISFSSSAFARAADNVIGLGSSMARGILFSGSDDAMASGNRIRAVNDSFAAIAFSLSDRGTASGNEIETSADFAHGVFFGATSTGGTASGNEIETSGEGAHGVYFDFAATGGTASGNEIVTSGTDAFGVFFNTAADGTATGNLISATGTGGAGIVVVDASGIAVAGNDIGAVGLAAIGTVGAAGFAAGSTGNTWTGEIAPGAVLCADIAGASNITGSVDFDDVGVWGGATSVTDANCPSP